MFKMFIRNVLWIFWKAFEQVFGCRSSDEEAERAGEDEDAEAGRGEEEGGAGGWKIIKLLEKKEKN